MNGLWMVELHPKWDAWFRWGKQQGLIHAAHPDLGYLAHAWMQALFGDLAPKPFRLWADRKRAPRILGYTRADAEALLSHARQFAEPAAWNALQAGQVQTKPMPRSWQQGMILGFEVLVAATRRKAKCGSEKDAFLMLVEEKGKGANVSREEAYREWFLQRMPEGLRLLAWRIDGFRLVRCLRRTQGNIRRARWIQIPEVLCRGAVQVERPEAIHRWLLRGMGRHCAFGYGMVLLRPA